MRVPNPLRPGIYSYLRMPSRSSPSLEAVTWQGTGLNYSLEKAPRRLRMLQMHPMDARKHYHPRGAALHIDLATEPARTTEPVGPTRIGFERNSGRDIAEKIGASP